VIFFGLQYTNALQTLDLHVHGRCHQLQEMHSDVAVAMQHVRIRSFSEENLKSYINEKIVANFVNLSDKFSPTIFPC